MRGGTAPCSADQPAGQLTVLLRDGARRSCGRAVAGGILVITSGA